MSRTALMGSCSFGGMAARRPCTKSTASWLLKTSNSPSHAMSRKSSSGVIRSKRISGSAMTRGFPVSAPSLSGIALYSSSPKARETANLPRTRRKDTKPPADSMRSASSLRSGLWSKDNCTARPSRDKSARLSPKFAHQIQPPTMYATTAAHPEPPLIPSWALAIAKNCLSVSRKPCMRQSQMSWCTCADLSSPPRACNAATKFMWRRCRTNDTHSRPPWPS
mmetsp:Transcript_48942/g.137720  ORF Transcript_48942/g.137720 Transcript_48942/m.137720 type:complete len:222 (+) Transcript_48942:210-875(+)